MHAAYQWNTFSLAYVMDSIARLRTPGGKKWRPVSTMTPRWLKRGASCTAQGDCLTTYTQPLQWCKKQTISTFWKCSHIAQHHDRRRAAVKVSPKHESLRLVSLLKYAANQVQHPDDTTRPPPDQAACCNPSHVPPTHATLVGLHCSKGQMGICVCLESRKRKVQLGFLIVPCLQRQHL